MNTLTHEQVAEMLGKAFTAATLTRTKYILLVQPTSPLPIFMSDPSGILVGAGAALLIACNNSNNEEVLTAWKNYYLKILSDAGETATWGQLLKMVIQQDQREAINQVFLIATSIQIARDRKAVIDELLDRAILIAKEKQKQQVDHL